MHKRLRKARIKSLTESVRALATNISLLFVELRTTCKANNFASFTEENEKSVAIRFAKIIHKPAEAGRLDQILRYLFI